VFLFFGDQPGNCKRAAYLNFGITLNVDAITKELLQESIHKILLNNSEYKNSVSKLQKLIDHKAGIRSADWIENIVKNGYQHLIPRYFNLPFYQKFNLDIILLFSLLIFLIINIFRFFFRKFCSKSTKVKVV